MWPQLPKNCVHPFSPLRVWTQNPCWQLTFRFRQPRRRPHTLYSVLAPDEVRGSEEEKQPAQVQLEESEGVKAKPKGRALRWPQQHVVGEEPRHFRLDSTLDCWLASDNGLGLGTWGWALLDRRRFVLFNHVTCRKCQLSGLPLSTRRPGKSLWWVAQLFISRNHARKG